MEVKTLFRIVGDGFKDISYVSTVYSLDISHKSKKLYSNFYCPIDEIKDKRIFITSSDVASLLRHSINGRNISFDFTLTNSDGHRLNDYKYESDYESFITEGSISGTNILNLLCPSIGFKNIGIEYGNIILTIDSSNIFPTFNELYTYEAFKINFLRFLNNFIKNINGDKNTIRYDIILSNNIKRKFPKIVGDSLFTIESNDFQVFFLFVPENDSLNDYITERYFGKEISQASVEKHNLQIPQGAISIISPTNSLTITDSSSRETTVSFLGDSNILLLYKEPKSSYELVDSSLSSCEIIKCAKLYNLITWLSHYKYNPSKEGLLEVYPSGDILTINLEKYPKKCHSIIIDICQQIENIFFDRTQCISTVPHSMTLQRQVTTAFTPFHLSTANYI